MAKFRHISTKLVLALDAGSVNGKKATKRVTISNIREDASADALWELAEALGKLLAYHVAEVRLYKVEELEREDGDGESDKKGGAQKEADADMTMADNTRTDGGEALPAFASRGVELLEEKVVLAREARLGGHAPLLPALAQRDGAGYANTRNRPAAVFPGAAARMNSPPLSRELLAVFRVTPVIGDRKKAKVYGAGKSLRFLSVKRTLTDGSSPLLFHASFRYALLFCSVSSVSIAGPS